MNTCDWTWRGGAIGLDGVTRLTFRGSGKIN